MIRDMDDQSFKAQRRWAMAKKVLFLTFLALTSCAAPSDIMVRPSDGATMRCSAVGGGIVGASAALISQSSCVQDFRGMGYVTLDEYKASKENGKVAAQPNASTTNSADSSIGSNVSAASNKIPSQTELHPAASQPFSAVSKEGGYALSLNADWKQRPVPESLKNSVGALYAANQPNEYYFILTTESSQDISDFTAYINSKKVDITKNMTDARTSNAEQITINGFPAGRFEASGNLRNGFHVHYLFTIIKSKTRMFKIIAWTGESRFERAKPELEKLSQELKVLTD